MLIKTAETLKCQHKLAAQKQEKKKKGKKTLSNTTSNENIKVFCGNAR